MKKIIVFLLAAMPSIVLTQRLKPGDKCPELLFTNIINSPLGSASLSDFKGKLVVLDFGATTCVPCVHLMPTMDSLQKQFEGRLIVFMITPEKKTKVEAFLKNNKVGKQSTVPFIVEDSSLNALFPHKALPHEVWIGLDGNIAAITGPEYITTDNVKYILSGNKPSWPAKLDFAYDTTRSLFDYAREQSSRTISSVITGHLEEINTKGYRGTFDSWFDFQRYINYPLFDLYLVAYRKKTFVGIASRQLDIDSSLLPQISYRAEYGPKEEWKRKNSYCYEITFSKKIDTDAMYSKMAADLDTYFALHSSLEKRKLRCWVLTRPQILKKIPGEKGCQLHAIITSLNEVNKFPFIVNETGLLLRETTGITIPIDKKDIFDENKLKNSLKEKGFLITEAIREIEILSIKPKLK